MTSAIDIERQAAEWLVRLESPDRTPDQLGDFDSWLAADPRNRAAFVRLEAAWRRADALSRLRPLDGSVDENLLDDLPVGGARKPTRRNRPRWLLRGMSLAAALGVVALAPLAWHAYSESQWHTYRTEFGGFERVVLSDASVVYLNTSSEIRVRYRDNQREVLLERGEAMFEVEPDPARPFFVSAGDTQVRAIGTAFSVRLHDLSHVDVLVTEGSVAVTESESEPAKTENAAPPTLSAGETITIRDDRVHVAKMGAAQVRERLGWINGRVWFERKTLAEVVGEFNRYNRDQLVVADSEIARLQLGGAFDARDIDSFLIALSRTFGIRASVSNTPNARIIVLTGPEKTS